MWTNNLLYIVFIAQIFFISFYFPNKLILVTKKILREHPQSEYPKLYAVSPDALKMGLRIYRNANLLMLLLGVLIVLHGLFLQTEEMLNLDSMAVILGYFMLQLLPLMLVEIYGFKYLKLMRLANKETTRKAQLTPRAALNYISKPTLLFTIAMQFGFACLVIYFVFNPFEGFGGLANLVGVILADIIFLSIVSWNIYGRNKNPYLNSLDRDKQLKRIVRAMVSISNLMIVFVSVDLILSATDSRHLLDAFMSLYFLLIASVSFQAYHIEDIDFDVYRELTAPIAE